MNAYLYNQTKAEKTGREWSVSLLWILRGVLLLTIGYEIMTSDLLYAVEAAFALGLCFLPGRLISHDSQPSPLDLEIILLLMAVGNCTLGVAGNFYRTLPYYDKFLHVFNPLALAIYGGLYLFSTFGARQRTLVQVALVMLTALAITGASATWELLEYGSDQFFNSTTQGSPTMLPLDDTMWDLLLSALGALAGAILAARSRLSAGPLSILFGE